MKDSSPQNEPLPPPELEPDTDYVYSAEGRVPVYVRFLRRKSLNSQKVIVQHCDSTKSEYVNASDLHRIHSMSNEAFRSMLQEIPGLYFKELNLICQNSADNAWKLCNKAFVLKDKREVDFYVKNPNRPVLGGRANIEQVTPELVDIMMQKLNANNPHMKIAQKDTLQDNVEAFAKSQKDALPWTFYEKSYSLWLQRVKTNPRCKSFVDVALLQLSIAKHCFSNMAPDMLHEIMQVAMLLHVKYLWPAFTLDATSIVFYHYFPAVSFDEDQNITESTWFVKLRKDNSIPLWFQACLELLHAKLMCQVQGQWVTLDPGAPFFFPLDKFDYQIWFNTEVAWVGFEVMTAMFKALHNDPCGCFTKDQCRLLQALITGQQVPQNLVEIGILNNAFILNKGSCDILNLSRDPLKEFFNKPREPPNIDKMLESLKP